MVKLKKGSKRQNLAKKYNIQRMVAAHKKKARKLKNKGELPVTRRKPEPIPNCIFKKEVLENIKRTKKLTDLHAQEQQKRRESSQVHGGNGSAESFADPLPIVPHLS
ncbi:uncharacterized protein BXIN_2208 [Babesia sp. Xinjiang]|uniref:uncharacterized protein n=1 Tax=Babesia sp. Xinjiang TaxID=462227 RepID=UPI000A22334B|nr:uncharacterized protein BXIN_2208 [Babesia sp. Xinjiang]ORM40489.1 hypothetical protein BXIN_2208 [Babesia sp. Xinjiang]